MHDVLRQRLLRRIESLPEAQVYQVLDYIEFLESKYSSQLAEETSGLQRFAEGLEDKIRKRAMNPATLREAFQLISAADRVLQGVSSAGRQMLDDLGSLGEGGREGGGPVGEGRASRRPGAPPARSRPEGGVDDGPAERTGRERRTGEAADELDHGRDRGGRERDGPGSEAGEVPPGEGERPSG